MKHQSERFMKPHMIPCFNLYLDNDVQEKNTDFKLSDASDDMEFSSGSMFSLGYLLNLVQCQSAKNSNQKIYQNDLLSSNDHDAPPQYRRPTRITTISPTVIVVASKTL